MWLSGVCVCGWLTKYELVILDAQLVKSWKDRVCIALGICAALMLICNETYAYVERSSAKQNCNLFSNACYFAYFSVCFFFLHSYQLEKSRMNRIRRASDDVWLQYGQSKVLPCSRPFELLISNIVILIKRSDWWTPFQNKCVRRVNEEIVLWQTLEIQTYARWFFSF